MIRKLDFLIDVRDVQARGISRHATTCGIDVANDLIEAGKHVLLLAERHQAGSLSAVGRTSSLVLIYAPYTEYFARFDESVASLVNDSFQVRHTHSFAQFLDPRIGRPETVSATIHDLTPLHFGESGLLTDAEFVRARGVREFENMCRAIEYLTSRTSRRVGAAGSQMEEYIRLHALYTLEHAAFLCVPSEGVIGDLTKYLKVTGPAPIYVQEPTRFPAFYLEPHSVHRSRLAPLGLPPRFILFVGTPDRHKRLDLILEYLASVDGKSGIASVPVVVVGDQAGDNLFERLRTYKARDGQVLRLGNVPDHVLRSLYFGAIFTVIPSITEGYCLPFDEALLSGGRVIVSNLTIFQNRVQLSHGRAVAYEPFSCDSFIEATQRLTEAMDSAPSISQTRPSEVSDLLIRL